MSKTLFLVRHAHRDKDQGDKADNGLSRVGVQQALDLRDELELLLRPKAIALFSSPKKRCVETLEPIEAAVGISMQRTPALEEPRDNESSPELRRRIENFLGLCRDLPRDAVVACTHGEWIEEFFHLISGEKRELPKGSFVRIEFPRGEGRQKDYRLSA